MIKCKLRISFSNSIWLWWLVVPSAICSATPPPPGLHRNPPSPWLMYWLCTQLNVNFVSKWSNCYANTKMQKCYNRHHTLHPLRIIRTLYIWRWTTIFMMGMSRWDFCWNSEKLFFLGSSRLAYPMRETRFSQIKKFQQYN